MKTAAHLFLTLAIAAASLAFCYPSFADPLQPLSLTIENHQKLVTVKDGNGKWLFAQVISTPNLKISDVALGQNSTRLSLLDASGKTLWTENLDAPLLSVSPHGEWSDKFMAGLLKVTNRLGWKYTGSDTSPASNPNQFEFVVGTDDQLVTYRTSTRKHRFEITPIKNGFMAKVDESKTVIIVQPPAAPSAPAVAQASTP